MSPVDIGIMSSHTLLLKEMVAINFSRIETRNDLADFLDVPRKTLTYILYIKKTDNLYTTFTIPKKNGGLREINAPYGNLKIIQTKLSKALVEYQDNVRLENKMNANFSHAFEKNKSFITNAKNHRNKRYVLNIDLEDFFGSFHFGRVRGYFMKNKYFELSKEVSTVIAQIACYNGKLPQGSPSSPIITNMICEILDYKIYQISKKFKLNYTRYADDLTFSTNDIHFITKYDDFYNELSNIIIHSGFKINEQKKRLQFNDSRQEVTGLIVNKKVNVQRNYYKETRAMAHNLYTQDEFMIDGKEGSINQLEGRLSFINQIQWYNNKIELESLENKNKIHFSRFNGKEREYQKFLFYKYFYSNPKPLIITEGKTDILYLKAALKKLYSEYPDLIIKNTNKYFEYNISFLNRTKRLKYFLSIFEDGADTMKNIYKFYSNKGEKIYPNFIQYFEKLSPIPAINPVILVFDNEINTNGKPLKTFVDFISCDSDQRRDLRGGKNIKINKNLYILTIPLCNKTEIEMEDLFEDAVLSIEIEGKKFNRKDIDNTKEYSKAIFAKYIYKNYKDINFDGFKPLLNELSSLISEYKKTITSNVSY